MASIVPYVGRLALNAGLRPGFRFAPSVAAGMANAMRYGRAAATIGRAARGYLRKRKYRAVRRSFKSNKRARLFSRTHVGESNGTTTAKVHIQDRNISPDLKDTRTLYSVSVCRIPQGTEIDERLRRHINVRGFKMCWEVVNLTAIPVYLNVAVICPKQTTNDGIEETDFFRDQTSNRSQNFSTSLTALEFHCLPINTDDYTVLKHKRYRLAPNGTSTAFNPNAGASYKNIDWYVKLNRQVRYTGTESNKPTDGDVYVVYWCDRFGSASGSTAQSNTLQIYQRYLTYFREPKN